jgi:hypothetical protein
MSASLIHRLDMLVNKNVIAIGVDRNKAFRALSGLVNLGQ